MPELLAVTVRPFNVLAPRRNLIRQVKKGRGIIKRFACFVLVAVIVAASAAAMIPAPISPRSTTAAPVTFTTAALPLDADALDSTLMSSQGAEIADAAAAATDPTALDTYNSFVDGFAQLLGVLDVALLLPTLAGGIPAGLVGGIFVLGVLDPLLSVVVLNAADLLLGFPVPFPVDLSTAPFPINPGAPIFPIAEPLPDSTTTLDAPAAADTAMPGMTFDVDPLPDLSTSADLGQEASDTLLNLLP